MRSTPARAKPNEPAPSMMQRTLTPSCALMQTASTKRRPLRSLAQMNVSSSTSRSAAAIDCSMAGYACSPPKSSRTRWPGCMRRGSRLNCSCCASAVDKPAEAISPGVEVVERDGEAFAHRQRHRIEEERARDQEDPIQPQVPGRHHEQDDEPEPS